MVKANGLQRSRCRCWEHGKTTALTCGVRSRQAFSISAVGAGTGLGNAGRAGRDENSSFLTSHWNIISSICRKPSQLSHFSSAARLELVYMSGVEDSAIAAVDSTAAMLAS